MKHSLLRSMLSKYFPCPELPHGAQIQTLCRGSALLVPNPSASLCHLSITHSASLPIYQPCFLPISFPKSLAKGCKHFWSILTGTLSLAFQSFTSTKTSNIYRMLSKIQLLQKQVAKDSVHLDSLPTSLYFLPSSSEPMTSQQWCPVISEFHTKTGLLSWVLLLAAPLHSYS